jgi:hypothetical protein
MARAHAPWARLAWLGLLLVAGGVVAQDQDCDKGTKPGDVAAIKALVVDDKTVDVSARAAAGPAGAVGPAGGARPLGCWSAVSWWAKTGAPRRPRRCPGWPVPPTLGPLSPPHSVCSAQGDPCQHLATPLSP